MNKILKKKWVAALRSNDYQQGRCSLTYIEDTKTVHCCLGVLGDICGLSFSRMNNSGLLSSVDCFKPPIDSATQSRLAVYNDRGKSFKWIAAYVQRYL